MRAHVMNTGGCRASRCKTFRGWLRGAWADGPRSRSHTAHDVCSTRQSPASFEVGIRETLLGKVRDARVRASA